MKIKLIAYLLILCFSAAISISEDKINIISLKANDTITYGELKIKKDSVYSKTCEKVLETFDFIGKNGMDVYNYCEGKYDLLGNNNSLIQTDNPFCFTNLDDFYCKFNVRENKNYNHNNTLTQETLTVILTTLKGCLKQNVTGRKKSPYKCPTFNNMTYKVENASAFCENGMKPERFAEKNGTTTYDYAIVPLKMKEICNKTVEVYNACIDSDNVLFPSSDYNRCFNPRHLLYMNSEIRLLSKEEQDLCSNFILPSIAWKNKEDSQFNKRPAFYCEGYEKKTFENYDEYSKTALEKEANFSEIINVQKDNIEKALIINTTTSKQAFHLKTIKSLWANFYPKFTEIYSKKRLYCKQLLFPLQ